MKKILLILFIIMFITGCSDHNQRKIDPDIKEAFYLKSNENKLVRENNDNYETYYYDGDKIIGYAEYIVYDSEESALKEYDKLLLDNKLYKNISLVSNVIIIEYSDEYINENYSDMTVSKLKEKYNDFITGRE